MDITLTPKFQKDIQKLKKILSKYQEITYPTLLTLSPFPIEHLDFLLTHLITQSYLTFHIITNKGNQIHLYKISSDVSKENNNEG